MINGFQTNAEGNEYYILQRNSITCHSSCPGGDIANASQARLEWIINSSIITY